MYLLEAAAAEEIEGGLDRSKFDDAFRDLRMQNYGSILDTVARSRSLNDACVLDVGCSSGWFLSLAGKRGGRCFGIEPDRFFFEKARRALPADVKLVHGYFPGDLPGDWPKFDVITFHDVFEHLENPVEMLAACAQRLAPGGILVLSVPSADGLVFRLSLLLRRFGITQPLERAFQVHFPFPHLLYLNPTSLAALARRSGYDVLQTIPLRGFRVRGSFHRAQMDVGSGTKAKMVAAANGLALAAFALLQPMVPPDNIAAILRRPENA